MAAYVILVLLALLWGAFFVSWYRSRSAQRVDSVARFSRHLSVLERATPGQVVPLRTVAPSERGVHRISSTPSVPRAVTVEPAPATTLTLAEAYQRRRTVLVGLAGSAAVTLVGALLAGGIFVALHLLIDVALVAYLVLLVRAQRVGAERRTKVTFLAPSSVRTTSAPGLETSDSLALTARSAHSG